MDGEFYTHSHTHTLTHTRTHAHTHTQMHIHSSDSTHTHTHTHTKRRKNTHSFPVYLDTHKHPPPPTPHTNKLHVTAELGTCGIFSFFQLFKMIVFAFSIKLIWQEVDFLNRNVRRNRLQGFILKKQVRTFYSF